MWGFHRRQCWAQSASYCTSMACVLSAVVPNTWMIPWFWSLAPWALVTVSYRLLLTTRASGLRETLWKSIQIKLRPRKLHSQAHITASLPYIWMARVLSLEWVTTFKLLRVIVSSDLTWGAHCDYLHKKCCRRLYLLLVLKRVFQSVTFLRSSCQWFNLCWNTRTRCGMSCWPRLRVTGWSWYSAVHYAVYIYPDLSYERVLTESGLPWLSQCREDLCRDFFRDMLLSPTHRLPAAWSRHAKQPAYSCHTPQDTSSAWPFQKNTSGPRSEALQSLNYFSVIALCYCWLLFRITWII